MQCQACGTDNPATARFCENCGVELGAVCPNCGFPARPGIRFCGNCGQQLVSPASVARVDYAPVVPAPTAPPVADEKGETLAGRLAYPVFFVVVVGLLLALVLLYAWIAAEQLTPSVVLGYAQMLIRKLGFVGFVQYMLQTVRDTYFAG